MPLENLDSLRNPIAIVALSGWADAGNAGSDLVQHLIDRYPGEEIARIEDESYFNFQEHRPIQRMRAEGTFIEWPHVSLHALDLPDQDQDLVVVHGVEPHLMWRSFTSRMMELLRDCNASMVLILGAQLVDTPHTRDFPCGVYSTNPDVVALHEGIDPTEYSGPTSALGVLAQRLDDAHIPTAQVWVSIPHYVVDPPNPKAQLALLEAIEAEFAIVLDNADLPEQTREWEEQVSLLISQTTDIATYVSELEASYDEELAEENNGHQVVQEIEEFLRGLNDDGESSR
ncbi:PAC2 family protein [Actinomycetaceae bacterium L2_0104]